MSQQCFDFIFIYVELQNVKTTSRFDDSQTEVHSCESCCSDKVSFLFPLSFSSRLHRQRPQSFAQSQGRKYSDFRV